MIFVIACSQLFAIIWISKMNWPGSKVLEGRGWRICQERWSVIFAVEQKRLFASPETARLDGR